MPFLRYSILAIWSSSSKVFVSKFYWQWHIIIKHWGYCRYILIVFYYSFPKLLNSFFCLGRYTRSSKLDKHAWLSDLSSIMEFPFVYTQSSKLGQVFSWNHNVEYRQKRHSCFGPSSHFLTWRHDSNSIKRQATCQV